MNKNKFFGTDGVRGIANIELDAELAFELGRASATVLSKSKKANILIANDSRISSDMLEAALVAGICSVGGNAHIVGVLPTPALAYLVKKYEMDAGIMISASHNPFYDNGIKLFDRDGYKLSDALEEEIEALILNKHQYNETSHENIGRRFEKSNAVDEYTRYIAYAAGLPDLSGKRIAIDCANGATFEAAPRVFKQLGAEVIALYNSPNGININDECGSTKIENLANFVRNNPVDFAFAYDGDGDRLYAVDEFGNILDGDAILSIIADYMHANNKLKHNTLVGTVMTNLGLIKAADELGIKVEQERVGDRYILERMLNCGYNLGGEASGHIIFLDYSTTGDGILASLILSSIIVRQGKKLSKINTIMQKMPQVLKNIHMANDIKSKIMENAEVMSEIGKIEETLGKTGRILVRPSGTEPLLRIMIEGEDLDSITALADDLAEKIIVLGGK